MFWKRMTVAAGFWSLLTGTIAAIAAYLLYLAGVLPFDSDLEESFRGAGIAFVLVVVAAFVMSVRGRPKREEELRGPVSGMGGVDLKGDVIAGDAAPVPLAAAPRRRRAGPVHRAVHPVVVMGVDR
jgi:SSS family solute:Na+ symporter